MEKVGIALLKDRLSEFLQKVRRGTHVVITDHGTPVAKIVPIDATPPQTLDERILQMHASGTVTQYCLRPTFASVRPLVLGAGELASRMIREDRER